MDKEFIQLLESLDNNLGGIEKLVNDYWVSDNRLYDYALNHVIDDNSYKAVKIFSEWITRMIAFYIGWKNTKVYFAPENIMYYNLTHENRISEILLNIESEIKKGYEVDLRKIRG